MRRPLATKIPSQDVALCVPALTAVSQNTYNGQKHLVFVFSELNVLNREKAQFSPKLLLEVREAEISE